MKTTVGATVILLCLTAFLAPVIGGNINLEASALEPGFGAIVASVFYGSEASGFANLLISLGAFACVLILVSQRRVLQLPSGRISLALLLFVGLLTVGVIVSPYKSVSVAAWAQWMAYAIIFFAAASGAGRVRGPSIVLGAFLTGCTLLAAKGIHEWGQQHVTDPSWRISGGWNNPNALAGILVIGFVIGLTLCTMSQRLASLLAGLGSVLIGFALFLTQSRGGVYAGIIGALLLLIGIATQSDKSLRKAIVKPIACIALIGVCVAGILVGNSSIMGKRLASSSTSSEQSSGFRKLLWRGAIVSMKTHPVGSGLGSYAFVSAESGLTTETKLAHNTLLQLGVETSVVTPLALIAVFGFWLVSVLRGKQPNSQTSLLRVGIVVAIAASLFDGLFESNLYYFGIGAAVFLLLGLGLQAATDAVAPEFSPPSMRRSLGIGVVVITAILAVFGYREIIKGHVRFDRQAADPEAYAADLASLKSIADGDGEAHYLLGFQPNSSNQDRLAQFREATDLEPTLKHYKLLGEASAQNGDYVRAKESFEKALTFDPNNLETLSQKLKFEQATDHPEDAVTTAKRMVDVESKPYFNTRALSEIIPLETVEARVYLASQSRDRKQVAEYLGGATDLFVKYARNTVPYMRKIWGKEITSLVIGGETQTGMLDKLQRGVEVAKSARVAYRVAGMPTEELDASEAELERVLADATAAFGNK